jgi:hypothetical protein
MKKPDKVRDAKTSIVHDKKTQEATAAGWSGVEGLGGSLQHKGKELSPQMGIECRRLRWKMSRRLVPIGSHLRDSRDTREHKGRLC